MGLPSQTIVKRNCLVKLTCNINNLLGISNNSSGTLRDFVFDHTGEIV